MHSLPYGRLFSVNAACRFDALQWFDLLCEIAGLLFLFCMRLLDMLLCAFCVWTDAFVSLYVSEFFLLLAEFRPCEGDQPLPKPQEGCTRAGPQRFLASGAGLWVLFT